MYSRFLFRNAFISVEGLEGAVVPTLESICLRVEKSVNKFLH